MHAREWDGPPDLGDHHCFLSRLGRSSAWSSMRVMAAAALFSWQQDLRSMSAQRWPRQQKLQQQFQPSEAVLRRLTLSA